MLRNKESRYHATKKTPVGELCQCRDAKTSETRRKFKRSLRLAQLCVLAFFFGLYRQVFFPFEQRRSLWIYPE